MSETLLSYFHRSVQAVLGGGGTRPEGMESAHKPQLLQRRLELPLDQVFGMQPLLPVRPARLPGVLLPEYCSA